MPTSFQMLEQSLPRTDDKRGLGERVDSIYGYLFQLIELLRYTLDNLGADNFNDKELSDLSDLISEPIYKRVEDAEGNISEIAHTSDSILARLSNAEGNISSLTLTAEMNSSRLSDAEGNISSLTQTSSSLSSRITSAEGDISNLTQTASSLTSRISNAEGEVSSLSQTVGSFSSRISNTEGEVSSLYQTVNGTVLTVTNGESSSTIALVRDGVAVSSGEISFSGFVTFSDLSESGRTTINGDNITTGTINVDLIKPNNGIYVGFSNAISAPSMHTSQYALGENATICLGSKSTVGAIKSVYPRAITLEGTTILWSPSYACSYRNNGFEFHEILTSANIKDYLEVLDVTAKFG